MREWHLTYADPIAPCIAADARAGRTNYLDDQAWQLRLGQPDEPAVTLETRYGGRVGLMRLLPVWFVGRRQIYEAQGYHTPPTLVAFAPDFLRLHADLTLYLRLTMEFWTMDSQVVGGRFRVHNTSDHPQNVRLDLVAQAMRENQAVQMFFLTLEGDLVALQIGRKQIGDLEPVLMLESAHSDGTSARLSSGLAIAPGNSESLRWVLASTPDRDSSIGRAYRWLSYPRWDDHLHAIEQRQAAAPQIDTGHADWDAALAWSQQLVLRAFLGATGSLPHPSFVSTRKPNYGFALGGQHSGGFKGPWGGQSLPEALFIAPTAALAAPELAQGMVRNFLAVQRDDGWIDARPGLGGQRANVLAPPLLATLAYTVYHYTRDRDFLADCLDGLIAFFERWFKRDVDADADQVPEWTSPEQGAFSHSPLLAAGQRWGQGITISTLEAPDLLAYLTREARSLVRIAEVLGRDDIQAEYAPRLDDLRARLDEMWDGHRGVFFYRDRDSHACPSGEPFFEGKGDQPLDERTTLPTASRLILRATGGLSRKPKLGCTIEGIDAEGKGANETLEAADFDWYRSSGSATTRTIWREIKYLKFHGLSRVYKVSASTVDLTQHDLSLFMPLWTGVLSAEQVEATVAIITDPNRYWREYGISGCAADDPLYDASMQNGCGGTWPSWNARLAWALMDNGYQREATDLFRRTLAAQVRALYQDKAFRTPYNPDTGEPIGDRDTLDSVVSLGWFARLFGAFIPAPGEVVITGPFWFEGDAMRWTQYGITIERSGDRTAIHFASGQTVTLKPDAEPQVVRDPKIARDPKGQPSARPVIVEPEGPIAGASDGSDEADDSDSGVPDPFDGLLPDGT
ncbi:MAG: hypothetical protein GYB65_20480 [Chloroflexi bacterium]|nr:hypothetical protein [Chloroflexota bacterium]